MDYESLSDLDINRLVAKIVKPKKHEPILDANCQGNSVFVLALGWMDYCNKPDDAWPIILENKIDIFYEDHPRYDEWSAGKWVGDTLFNSFNKTNPLRAAMIVYLEMQEQK